VEESRQTLKQKDPLSLLHSPVYHVCARTSENCIHPARAWREDSRNCDQAGCHPSTPRSPPHLTPSLPSRAAEKEGSQGNTLSRYSSSRTKERLQSLSELAQRAASCKLQATCWLQVLYVEQPRWRNWQQNAQVRYLACRSQPSSCVPGSERNLGMAFSGSWGWRGGGQRRLARPG